VLDGASALPFGGAASAAHPLHPSFMPFMSFMVKIQFFHHGVHEDHGVVFRSAAEARRSLILVPKKKPVKTCLFSQKPYFLRFNLLIRSGGG
jgi:hypothetical protein